MTPSESPFRRYLREVRRRRVPQTTVVYLVVSFGVLEAAELAFPRLGLPDWTVTLVLALVLLGLPIVVFLSWTFDLTGRGIERTAAEGTETSGGNGEGAGPTPWGAVVAALILVSVGLGAWLAGRALLRSDAPLQADLVVVPPFRVSGDAGYLEEGMVDLLAAKLTGEGGLRAAEPRAVLAAWPGTESPDAAAAQVARELGAGKILLGSVVATGARLYVAGRVHRTRDFEELARYEVEGAADSLPGLVDRFLAGLLAQVAGVDNTRIRELERTPLPAIRAYLEGHAALRGGRFVESRDAFRRALEEDTTFALAGIFHTVAASFTSDPTAAGMRLAWRHRDRLAPRDRVTVEAYLGPEYPGWSTRQERLEAYRQLTRQVPDRAEAWYLRGDYIYHQDTGSPVADRLERATLVFSEAVELDPNFGPATLHLLETAMHQRDTALARSRATTFLEAYPAGDLSTMARSFLDRLDGHGFVMPPDSVDFDLYRVLAYLVGPLSSPADIAAADRAVEWTLDTASDAETTALREVARYLMDRGRPGQALSLLRDRDLLTEAERAVFRVYGALYWETGETLNALEQDVAGLEALAEARSGAAGVTWREAACTAGQFRAAIGAAATASRWARVLEEAATMEPGGDADRYARSCAALIGALVRLETGADPGDVIRTLDRYHADGTASENLLRDAATFVLARGYERLGDFEKALEATRRRYLGIPGINFRSTQAREEGRLAAALGRTDEAARAYRLYLAFRADPEPAVAPFVERARTELERLRGEG